MTSAYKRHHKMTRSVYTTPVEVPPKSLVPYKTRKDQVISVKLINNFLRASISINVPVPSLVLSISVIAFHKSTVPSEITLTLAVQVLVRVRDEFRNAHPPRLEALDNFRNNISSRSAGEHILRHVCFKRGV